MFLKLSKGEAKVWVWFGKLDDGRRTTNLQVTLLESTSKGVDMKIETVVCSKKDNFCKRTGRMYVLNKFLYGIPKGRIAKWELTTDCRPHVYWTDVFTREDRAALWQAICPEFYKGKERGKWIKQY